MIRSNHPILTQSQKPASHPLAPRLGAVCALAAAVAGQSRRRKESELMRGLRPRIGFLILVAILGSGSIARGGITLEFFQGTSINDTFLSLNPWPGGVVSLAAGGSAFVQVALHQTAPTSLLEPSDGLGAYLIQGNYAAGSPCVFRMPATVAGGSIPRCSVADTGNYSTVRGYRTGTNGSQSGGNESTATAFRFGGFLLGDPAIPDGTGRIFLGTFEIKALGSGSSSITFVDPNPATPDNQTVYGDDIDAVMFNGTMYTLPIQVTGAAIGTPPSISTQPMAQAACPGSSVTFSIVANGSPTPTYQWRKNAVNIGGATGTSYIITSVDSSDSGTYDVVLSNTCGSVTSDPATLTLSQPPSVDTQPSSQTVAVGGAVAFSVSAMGSAPLSYHWYKNGIAIAGATGATYSIPVVASNNAGFYYANVSNACESVTSNGATLIVLPAMCASSFAAAANYGAGTNPASVAVGDLNGDGRPDLAVANNAGNDVSVLLGNGNGTYQAAVNYAAGSSPASLAIGDLNGDGRQDLAVANQGSNDVSVLLGTGNGAFTAPASYTVGSYPFCVVMSDFNNDGQLDLAAANVGSSNVSVLLGHGDGTFAAAVNYSAGNGARSLAVGDLNGDGKADQAVANGNSYSYSLLLGNGDGTFGPTAGFFVPSPPVAVAIGDLNGDGKLDLAVAESDGGVMVLLGSGNGTFTYGPDAVSYATGSYPFSVAIGDLNGDGRPDLALANYGDNNVSALLGNGDGSFQTAINYGAGTYPLSAAIGDLNGDGRLDLAVTNSGSNDVSVLLNTSPMIGISPQPAG